MILCLQPITDVARNELEIKFMRKKKYNYFFLVLQVFTLQCKRAAYH